MSAKLLGRERIEARLSEIADKLGTAKSVEIGFMEDATYPDGTPVAQVALWNEFGNDRIPPRPFFRDMIKQKSPDWSAALANFIKYTGFDARTALSDMGEGIQGQLQMSIRDWKDPPNAASTVAKKGFDKPLIDTAQMLRSVDYEVKE